MSEEVIDTGDQSMDAAGPVDAAISDSMDQHDRDWETTKNLFSGHVRARY